jgi:hypothetical protein
MQKKINHTEQQECKELIKIKEQAIANTQDIKDKIEQATINTVAA